MSGSLRLHVYMSRCGVGARRKCEKIIADGRVSVNGTIVTEMGRSVETDDVVSLDGALICPVERSVHYALHKPVGFLCSNHDRYGRPLAVDLIHRKPGERVFHVGRLDMASSGLIFYTNDGAFAQGAAHPSSGVEKEYLVETRESMDKHHLQLYQRGIDIEGESYKLCRYGALSGRRCRLVLSQGKNREIRKVLRHFGYHVSKIHRIRIGVVELGMLKPGRYRDLTPSELQWFALRRGLAVK